MSVRVMSLVFEANIVDIILREKGRRVTAPTLKLVLLALADHANDEGESAYPSQHRLARKTSLERSSITYALSALMQEGFILRAGISKRDTINYTLNLPQLKSLVHLVDTLQAPLPPGGQRVVHQVEGPCPPSGHESSFKRPLNVIEEYPEKKIFWNGRDLSQVWLNVCEQLVIGTPTHSIKYLDSAVPVQWNEKTSTLVLEAENTDWLNSRVAKSASNLLVGLLNLPDPHVVFTPRGTAL